MNNSPTGERRDTYDSRRIDGLEASYARLEERVDNMREVLRDQASAARQLKNGIYVGSVMLTFSTLAGILSTRIH